jgi:hypothetical protein
MKEFAVIAAAVLTAMIINKMVGVDRLLERV